VQVVPSKNTQPVSSDRRRIRPSSGSAAVYSQKPSRRDPQERRQTPGIAVRDSRRGNAAAVSALCAVNLLFNALRDAPQDPIRVIVRFHKAPETQILFAFLLAEQTDLYQVTDHSLPEYQLRNVPKS
jgi:hypothetical protein